MIPACDGRPSCKSVYLSAFNSRCVHLAVFHFGYIESFHISSKFTGYGLKAGFHAGIIIESDLPSLLKPHCTCLRLLDHVKQSDSPSCLLLVHDLGNRASVFEIWQLMSYHVRLPYAAKDCSSTLALNLRCKQTL